MPRSSTNTQPGLQQGSGQLVAGKLLYRSGGEILRLAGPAGKPPTALVQIITTDWRRTADQGQALADAFRRLSAWNNPGALVPIDFGIIPSTGVYITFPLRNGRLLKQLISGGRTLDLPMVVELLAPLAECLDRGHRDGRLHLALAPTQIVIGRTGGDCGLFDFGLRALVLAQDPARDPRLDRERWPYWAPEVWRGETLQAATDQFALASLAYQMLTGRPLVDAADHDAAAEQCERGLAAACGALDARLQPVFSRALAARGADRYDCCGAFVDALAGREASGGQPAEDAFAQAASAYNEIDSDYEVLVDFSDDEPFEVPVDVEPIASGGPPPSDAADAGRAAASATAEPAPAERSRAASDAEAVRSTAVEAAPPEEVVPVEAVAPHGRLRRWAGRTVQLATLGALVALPLGAYGWTRTHRPQLTKLVPREPAEPVVPVPDEEINMRAQYVAGLLDKLRAAGLAELAPTQWKESQQLAQRVRELSQAFRVNDFVEAADEADEKLLAYLWRCNSLRLFGARHDEATARLKSPAAGDGLVEQYDKDGWAAAERLVADALAVRDQMNVSEAHRKLDELDTHLADRRWVALREAALRGESMDKRLEYATLLVAAGRADAEVMERFGDAVRSRPEFWLEAADAALAQATPLEKAFAWAERAAALGQLGDSRWTEAFETAPGGSRRRARAAAQACERLLEVALELGEPAAARSVLDDVRTANAPAAYTRRLVGYSLLVGDEASWRALAPAALAGQEDKVGPLAALNIVARYTGDYSAAESWSTAEADLLARSELALAAAERGDRAQFEKVIGRLEQQTASAGEAERQIVAAHRDAGTALLGDYQPVAAKLAAAPADKRDFVGTFAALAAARAGDLDAAQQALAAVSPDYVYRVRPLREIARRWPRQDGARMGKIYQWAAGLPNGMQRAAACAGVFFAVRSPGPPANVPPLAAGKTDKAGIHWAGTLTSPANGRSSVQTSEAIDLFALAPRNDGGKSAALVTAAQPEARRHGFAAFSPWFTTLMAVEPPRGSDPTSPRTDFVLFRHAERTLGLRVDRGTSGEAHVTGVVALDQGRPIDAKLRQWMGEQWKAAFGQVKDAETVAKGRQREEQMKQFFERMALAGRNQTALWELQGVNRRNTRARTQPVIYVQVQGSRERRNLVAELAGELNRVLPSGYRMRVYDEAYGIDQLPKTGEYRLGYIYFHFADRAAHREFAKGYYGVDDWPQGKAHHAEPVSVNRMRIRAAVAMIDAKAVGDGDLERVVSMEMLRTLGIGLDGESDLPFESVFGTGRTAPRPQRFTPLDKAIVRFLYSACGPGERKESVMGKYLTGWSEFYNGELREDRLEKGGR